MATHRAHPATLAVLLAGGKSKRFGGGDKGLREIAGRSLIACAIERLKPQCDSLILNANGEPSRLPEFGLPVIPDNADGHSGPLAGILAGLDYLSANDAAEWLVSAPVDCPFLPRDLVERLHSHRGSAKIVVAQSADRAHPIVSLWHVSLRADLYHALVGEDVRKAGAFVARHAHSFCEWKAEPFDPFFNVNTPEDLAKADRIMQDTPDA